jgi:hypothetical protein
LQFHTMIHDHSDSMRLKEPCAWRQLPACHETPVSEAVKCLDRNHTGLQDNLVLRLIDCKMLVILIMVHRVKHCNL